MSEMGEEKSELSNAERLWRIRHSASHVLATAVLEVFPEAKLAIGPPIENGFYYDFDLPRALTPDDLEDIEARMAKHVKANDAFETWTSSVDEAIAYFEQRDQPYKIELIRDLAAAGETEVRFYKNGPFVDLCAGPHAPRTGACKAFKLLKVAGAYWRGDSDRPMLQRVYGTAWKNKTDLAAHLELLEEAKKRDHRKLARELDLFSFQKISPGAVFWHPKGWTIYSELKRMSLELHKANGYVEICNPLIYSKSLFETSGHWDHYNEHMFKLESEGETFCVKPMNCPDTMMFYKRRKHSYRELPLRVAEFQTLHRNELSGALNGVFRVRQFTQDDSHIFCTEEQIEQEIGNVVSMIDHVYGLFDLTYQVKLSTRPADFMGEPALWDRAEAALASALTAHGLEYRVNEGDGAFYGPKIDFDVLDSLGRKWQCATIQLDFQLPRRFELAYTAADNEAKTPIVVHRALFGSLERFIGILVEHVAGAFPTWLAPVQAIFLPINDACAAACHDAARVLLDAGLRVEVDDRSEKLGYKIREAELAKVPHMLVVGAKELEAGTFALRTYQGGDQGSVTLDELRALLLKKVETREFDVTLKKIEWSTEDDDEQVEHGSAY
ncbi:MAG: threonine--tRNA ligase [Myxococcales bacterium]|nr:threonine--tRNA ligase [Myxococcales bacterium]MCB9521598.1 threonine--tRNA ligase [Myxococcales bacterium]MCB9532404.1 threonine--tRNA ligase [Myxococcales bacterium]